MNSRLGLDASKTVSTLNADNYEMYVLDETKLCIKNDLVPGEVMYYFVPKEQSGIVKIINSSD